METFRGYLPTKNALTKVNLWIFLKNTIKCADEPNSLAKSRKREKDLITQDFFININSIYQ